MVHRGVGEELAAVHVADRVDAVDVRPHHGVDRDVVAVGLEPDLLEADVLDVALAADRDQSVSASTVRSLPLASLIRMVTLVSPLTSMSSAVGAGAEGEVHLLAAEGAGERVLDLLVLVRDDVADEGDLGAVAMVDRGPLDAGRARRRGSGSSSGRWSSRTAWSELMTVVPL
jgi:hypothetical protein